MLIYKWLIFCSLPIKILIFGQSYSATCSILKDTGDHTILIEFNQSFIVNEISIQSSQHKETKLEPYAAATC